MQLRVVVERVEEVVDELGLQGGLTTGDRDAGQEVPDPADVVEHVGHGDQPGAPGGQRDRVRVVAREAVEVAALQEDDVPVAGPVDPAERDGVSEQAEMLTHR